ncbi:hypothetical protein [Phaeodactylibacter xiamenensis]|uniref:hypothetical protein n=1 Tax=Phaeodactylibacter xiamenensis TaxID=1524460 RepID=UPI003BA9CCA3
MYTLTIVKAISIALLSACPMAQPGLSATSTDLFGTHQLNTAYGLMNIQVGLALEQQASALAIGPQTIFVKNAPLIRVLELMDLPLAPCPLTAYNFGPLPSTDDFPEQEGIAAQTLLAERIHFKISCSDCQLENLQEVAFEFLQSKLPEGSERQDHPQLLSQAGADQANR